MASLLLAAVPAHAAKAGDLDPSFSGDGKQTTYFGGAYARAAAGAIQPDGKVVVVGSVYTNSYSHYHLAEVVARYNRDGSLDRSFSGDGKATLRFPNATSHVSDVTIQRDRIVVAGGYTHGPAANGSSDTLAIRLNSNGTLDRTFSGDGRAVVDFGGSDYASELALDSQRRIVLAGSTTSKEGSRDFAVARLTPSGSLDGAFSGDGRETTDFAGMSDSGAAVAVQPDGKVVVAGDAYDAESWESNFALARYNADGTLDPIFSSDGKQTTSLSGEGGGANDLAIQPDGKFVVAGSCCATMYGGDSVLARYDPSGGLNRAFGHDGKMSLFRGDNAATGVALQRDGKIVVAGYAALRYEPYYFALARLDTGGSFDASFSDDGETITEFPGGRASDVKIQRDGKIVAVGSAGSDFALARYFGAARPDCTVTGSSRADVLVGTPGDDLICAGAGNDVVRPGGGNDTVYGGPGNDVLRGDGGSDRLYGQGGNDALKTSDGKRGNDLADGGGGNDACSVDPGDRRRSC